MFGLTTPFTFDKMIFSRTSYDYGGERTVKTGYVVTLGVSCIDEYYSAESWIPEGEKGIVRWTDSRVGGMIPNAACVFAGLGKKTYLITALNSGSAGRMIRRDLEKWNVDLSYAITDDSLSDPKCFIINTPKERTILVSDTSEIRYSVDQKLHELLLGAECVYTSMMEFHRLEEWEGLAQELAENGVKLAFDLETSTFGDWTDPLFSYANLLFFNKEGWKKFKAGREDEECMQSLFGCRAEIVVITLGAEGCYCRTCEKAVRMCGNPVKAVDTTGAGDTFNCAFTVCALSGKTLDYAAEFANAAGAYAVTGHGARAGVASPEEIEKRMIEFRKERRGTE